MHNNPYEWPFPQRTDLMNLQTIENQKRSLFQDNRAVSSLNVKDIDGTQSILKPYTYTNKESFQNRIDDIQGTRSKQLIRDQTRSSYQLTLDDIQGTRPQINKFRTNRPPANPLEPIYLIPSYSQVEPQPTKFIRDSISVQDIDGAQPISQGYKLKKQPIQLEDVEGSHPKQRFVPKGLKNNKYIQDYVDSLQVKDINEFMKYKTNRVTNPIQPTYDHHDQDGNKIQIGFIEGSKSRQLHPKDVNKATSQILSTQDIRGAQADSHADYFLKRNIRKDYRSTNNVEDIAGVKAGSLRKGITSTRYTNPLMPNYQFPGNTEIYEKSVFQKNASTQLLSTAQKMDQFLNK